MAIDRVYLAPLMKYLVGQKMMWISRIILNNWRAYDHTEFEIPRGDMDANVVIIGAKNGVGKTSLLEAITLCLYGERAIHYLSRGNIGIQNYKNFMDQAQYKFSDESSQKSSVSLLFETDNNKKILLERSWHFGGPNIGFRPPDELQIQVDGDPLPIPALEGLSNRTSFLEGYIADNFLPPDLLPFFLFDGGQVQKMAQRDMKDQIKSGIEGILGIPLIDKLIKDLEEYADQRGRQGRSGLPSDTKLDDMDRKIEEIHRKLKNIISSLESLTGQLKKAKMEQDALFERYQAIGGDAVVNLGALRVKSEELRNTRKKLMKDFTDLLIGEFAISLAGKDMLIETSSRLRREISRESWERDRNSGAQRYEKFLANLEKEKALVLPLSEEEIAKLHKDLKVAWDGVWCPMPDDCAKTLFNPGFSEEEKRSTVEKMDGLSESNPGRQLETLRRELEQNKADQDIVDRKILAVRGDNEKEAKDLVDEIKRKSDQIASLERNIGDCERQQKAAEHDLEHARQERGRAFADRKSKDPYLYQSMRAGQAAAMTKKIINKSYSHYVDDIASEMTSAYISMANKDIVSKIEIGNDCDIKLLTSQGNDLREMVLSHGESEIFALALIAAIARVSRTCFPFIIDTPLANLDEQHRRAFLHYFSADMKNQVLFLSTDEEIRGRNMKILRNRVARKFLIEQERLGNIWRNVVRPDCYFEED